MGRLSRLLRALPNWVRIAWWGLASPRFERAEPVVHQAVVVDDAGRVLLSLRDDLCGWELPGGAALPGESDSQAVCREVREETGLEVEVVAPVGDYRRSGFRPHRARVYRCRVRSGVLRASGETPHVAWFEPVALPRTLFPWYRGPLSDGLAARAAPVVRYEHQGWRYVLAGLWIDACSRWRGWDRDGADDQSPRQP